MHRCFLSGPPPFVEFTDHKHGKELELNREQDLMERVTWYRAVLGSALEPS